ncbi:MAG: hypothetical protein P1Q69_06055 [Candidatus Thorarchaeota archaeon]|nr:hypothetical protein [Candidatus Thorarchaeota archaeon]
MSETRNVKELFVIHMSGLPIGHIGTGQVQIDDALFGGLLSAIDNVGQSLGVGEGGALDSIGFQSYDLVYARAKEGLIVLLTGEESIEFKAKAKEELQAIGQEIEARGYLTGFSLRTSELASEIEAIITSKARTIFARQDDVFLWDDDHTFQLVEHKNERWKGQTLFSNYLMLSPLKDTISLPMDKLERLCDILVEKKSPAEILADPMIDANDEKSIQDTMRFLHIYGLVHCFGTRIHR